MQKRIIPVILAGGTGTRLWPVSRESYPKQFCRLFDEKSLLQTTAIRTQEITQSSDLIIITNESYHFLCQDQLADLLSSKIHYILEPCGRNTAPAIALAAEYAQKYIAEDAILLVLPSDHYLEDNNSFKDTMMSALDFAAKGNLIIFGVQPTAPKTGYGYIEKGQSAAHQGFQVKQFVEKPPLEKAKEYLTNGNFYWNSGIFLFTAKSYLTELALHAADIYHSSLQAFNATEQHKDFFRVNKIFAECRSASIDYEVMEKTSKAIMFPLVAKWNDLGCWASVAESGVADENGNVCYGNVMVSEAKNCLFTSENGRIIAIGLENLIVVNTADVVLVADKAYSQDVKKVVEQLKAEQDSVAIEHARNYQSWGFYDNLVNSRVCRARQLTMNPGATFIVDINDQVATLQWIVIQGKIELMHRKETLQLQAGKSVFLKENNSYTVKNATEEPSLIIEVQQNRVFA